MDMNIEFGSIEYFELLGLEDKLKGYRLDNLNLVKLDELRVEIARKIAAINLREKLRKEANEKRKGDAWADLGNTLYEGERDGNGV